MDTRTSRAFEGFEGKPFVLAAFFDGGPTDGGGYVLKLGLLRVLRRLRGEGLRT